MKEKRIIKYIKNGEEIKKEFNILTRKSILQNSLEEPYYQSGAEEIYKIKEDIDLIYISNMTFKKNIKFIIPEDTILILDKCIFLGGKIELIKGNIQLINPKFNPNIYINRIHAVTVNDLDIRIDSDNRGFITIRGNVNNFSMNIKERIEKISINGEKAILENIKDIKSLKLKNNETILKNCNFEIDLDKNEQDIMSQTLNIENCTLSYQTDLKELEKPNLINDNNLDISNALSPIIRTNDLNLINSKIESNNVLNISTRKISMDNNSSIKATNELNLSTDNFKAKNKEIEITPTTIQELTKTRNIISILKGIEELLQEKNNKKEKTNKKVKKLVR